MALPLPLSPSSIIFSEAKSTLLTKPITISNVRSSRLPGFASKRRICIAIAKASKDEDTTTTPGEERAAPTEQIPVGKSQSEEMAELGEEIKKAMKERQQKEGTGFFDGVIEEIQEIEWPAFDKVLGTTGVVLGVIVGSSVVLLTVNAVLSELSDRVFAGKGVQDFFG